MIHPPLLAFINHEKETVHRYLYTAQPCLAKRGIENPRKWPKTQREREREREREETKKVRNENFDQSRSSLSFFPPLPFPF
jgi:hypothetical protein